MRMRDPSPVWATAPTLICAVRMPRGSSTALSFSERDTGLRVSERGLSHAAPLVAPGIGLGGVGLYLAWTARPPEPVWFGVGVLAVAAILVLWGVFAATCYSEARIPRDGATVHWSVRRAWRVRHEHIPVTEVTVSRAVVLPGSRDYAAVLFAGDRTMLLKLARAPEEIDTYLDELPRGIRDRVSDTLTMVRLRAFG